jgi:hypothetical protein
MATDHDRSSNVVSFDAFLTFRARRTVVASLVDAFVPSPVDEPAPVTEVPDRLDPLASVAVRLPSRPVRDR